jgi:hypothetical protein
MKRINRSDKQKIRRIGVKCYFRWPSFSREFICPGNFEAFNMLKNKLDKAGVKNQQGRLVFEFDEKDKGKW